MNKMKKLLNISTRRIIILSLVSVVLTMAMVFGYQIEHYSSLHIEGKTVVALSAGFVIIFLFMYGLFICFDQINFRGKKPEKVSAIKVFLIIWAVMLGLYFVSFLALYPGLFVFDAKWQYDMYKGVEAFTEHHPVLHTLIIGFLIDTVYQTTGNFNYGVVAYTVSQILICSAAFSYMLTYVYKKTKSVILIVLSGLFVSLHPALVLQVMSATKDTPFLAFLVLNIVLSLELLEDAKAFFKRPDKYILWVVSTVLMIIFRNNCLYAVPFLLILLFVFLKSNRKNYIVMVMVAMLFFGLYKAVLVPAVTTDKTDGREMLSVPIQQIMRIYHTEGADITEEEEECVEILFEEWGRVCYDPKISDYPKVVLDMEYYKEHQDEINDMYLSLVKRNFKMSVESFVENTCGYWYPFSRLAWTYQARGYWIITDFSAMTVADSKIPVIYDYYKGFENYNFASGNPIAMFLTAPATYFYLFIAFFAYVIEQKKKSFYAVFTFVFMLLCTYLLGPVALVRYTTYFYAMVPLYFVAINKQSEQTEK